MSQQQPSVQPSMPQIFLCKIWGRGLVREAEGGAESLQQTGRGASEALTQDLASKAASPPASHSQPILSVITRASPKKAQTIKICSSCPPRVEKLGKGGGKATIAELSVIANLIFFLLVERGWSRVERPPSLQRKSHQCSVVFFFFEDGCTQVSRYLLPWYDISISNLMN